MLIHINLHPEGGKRRRGALALPTLPEMGKLRAPFRDKFLAVAVVAVAASCGGVAWLYTSQTRAAAALTAQAEAGVRDSARYAKAIAARTKVLARRDSLNRELRVIAAIDSTRYTWAHLLDEISTALPPYTWLTTVQQTSAPPAPPSTTVAAKPGAKPAAKPADKAPNGVLPNADSTALRFQIVGQTVDIQALTLYMRDLEASPFVKNVQLAHSEPVQSGTVPGGRELTAFTLVAEFEAPSRDVLRTVAITVPVR